MDENELQAYIGSDSEDEPEDAAKTAALRAALGLDASDKVAKSQPKRDRDFKKPTGDMEITFSAGLSANAAKGSVFENEPIVEETTIEKWQRKQKERKQKRKARAKAIREGRDPDAEEVNDAQHAKGKDEEDEEDPWNDPFFDVDPDSAMPSKAKSKKEKREARKREEEEEGTKAAERANLELLMVDDEDSNVRHFDMNSIMKAEKDSKKRKGKKKNKGETATVDDGFNIDTNDPRFAKLYESHEFAIDPTFKAYKETAGMKALLVESRNKRKRDRDDGTGADVAKKQRSKEQESGDVEDVKKLAARVKAKTKKA